MKMRNCHLFALGLLLTLMAVACNRFEGDQEIPSYLTIDAIEVVNDPSASLSYYKGFFTSEVDAAQVVAYFEGDAAETNLGTFQLPCKIPVLRKGVAKYVQVMPVVKQNGISGTRIYYPFYTIAKKENVQFAIDSVTSLGTLQVKYQPLTTVKWKEFFEPQSFSFLLDPDSLVTIVSDLDTVCSDYGCAAIRVPADKKSISFWIDQPFLLESPSLIAYLELDYKSDVPFSVGFNNPMTAGGSNVIQSMEVLYPTDGWQKMYINLGRLWSWYHYYPSIRLYFTVLNEAGKSGNVYLDNMKVVAI